MITGTNSLGQSGPGSNINKGVHLRSEVGLCGPNLPNAKCPQCVI